MSKVFRIIVGSFIAVTLAVSTGCSQVEPETSSNSPSETSTAVEEADGDDSEASTTANAASESRVKENVTLPAPGADPLEMIFEMRQSTGEPIGSEQIRVSYPAIDQAVVVHVLRGLPDDSVSAIRTRYEFKAVEGTEAGQQLWEVIQVTEQNKCRAGRGSEDWTGDLCS
ncbi:hypothetical protein C7B61_20275 [filamentous cyanobacterium CCP1]|nr:hypothetical protein C7B76_28715 [filamentous cyanobacterium CCP2]PSB56815.1 hypothetical protein C7B61_20275 [filamentous cyanobacterium CCP1]